MIKEPVQCDEQKRSLQARVQRTERNQHETREPRHPIASLLRGADGAAEAVSIPSLIVAAGVSRLTFPEIRIRLERTDVRCYMF